MIQRLNSLGDVLRKITQVFFLGNTKKAVIPIRLLDFLKISDLFLERLVYVDNVRNDGRKKKSHSFNCTDIMKPCIPIKLLQSI